MAGGGHLNRPIQELVQQAGFDIAHLGTGNMDFLRVLAWRRKSEMRWPTRAASQT
jgi:hypothetical protein